MKDDELGRLERVDLREVWSKEADNFTPWLAREENLPLVGDTIGLELELEAQEKNVGPFRADLLCKDTATNSWVGLPRLHGLLAFKPQHLLSL